MDDPLSLLAFAVWTLATGMYPLGFMFGVCSACCEEGCRSDTCEGFDLEEAFSCRNPNSGFPLCFRSPDLLSLRFTSPCFGSGAAGTVQGTGADVGAGPLTGVTLTNGGSGYAILGRRAPAITLTNASAAPATLIVNTQSVQDNCQIDTWRISSVTVNEGGRGYAEWGTAFSPAIATASWAVETGGVVVAIASGTIAVKQAQPTITASASGAGTGATFSVALELVGNPELNGGWRIDSVAVSGVTSGYVNGSAINFDIGNASLHPFTAPAIATINANENGEITSVTVQSKGLYAITGVINTVTFASNAQRGSYYYPDPSLPACVRPPNVTVVQTAPYNQGSGAQITAAVDGDPASPTFGEVTGLTLANAGTNYLAWYRDQIEYLGDGKFALGTLVPNPQPGDYVNSAEIRLGYRGVPTKGCWVSGDGIAFGTQVTELSNEILDMGVSQPANGCCRYSYVWQRGELSQFAIGGSSWNPAASPPETIYAQAVRTEAECQEEYDNLGFEIDGARYLFSRGSTYRLESKEFDIWDTCKFCNGDPITIRGFATQRTFSGRWIVTVDPPPVATPTGCVRFCGQSGLCGGFPGRPYGEAPTFGEDLPNSDFGRDNGYRRMCVRWLCRCYEGTGKKNQFVEEINPETGVGYTPEEGGPYFTAERVFPDPYDWYTVESTTEVGGPVVFGGTLTEKLEAATSNYFGYEKFEHEYLFGELSEWQAAEGDRFCLVYAFVFYGTSQKAIQDRCNFPDDEAPPGTVTPKDAYQIFPCDRCSCQ